MAIIQGCCREKENIRKMIENASRLWILRILLLGDNVARFAREEYSSDREEIGEFLGFSEQWTGECTGEEYDDWSDEELHPGDVKARLEGLLSDAEAEACNASLPRLLDRKISEIQTLASLSSNECKILSFLAIRDLVRPLELATKWVQTRDPDEFHCSFAEILGESCSMDVAATLDPKGKLRQSGVILHRARYGGDDEAAINGLMFDIEEEPNDVAIDLVFRPGDVLRQLRIGLEIRELGSTGPIGPQVPEDLQRVMVRQARRADSFGKQGVHYLLHGDSEEERNRIACAFAGEVVDRVIAVPTLGKDGYPEDDSSTRVEAWFRSQHLLEDASNVWTLVENADDIFEERGGWHDQKLSYLMRSSTAPTIWTCSSIDDMDPLFVSKFAFVIGLSAGRNPSTTELVRESVTELGGISDEGLVNRLSRLEGLTPDILQRATISSSYFGYDSSNGADALRVLEKSVHSLLRAKGVALDPAGDIPDEFRNFDPAKCECDTSLCEVLESLKKQEFTTLVLYGTEGTGKRSFAKWISQQLDRPLHVQDGTDLIGENEHGTARRVALALRYALQAGAVLFVDNAGELIASHCERDEADPNATLLAQLHSYSGILLLSVPYRSKHHVKPLLLSLGNPIKFRYLAYQKLREMFADYCSRLGLAIPSEEDLSELAEKDQVTPGAFFEAARAAWLTAVGQPRDFLYLIVSSNVYFDED